MAKISVIVPAYNAEKTIDKCLESLVNQTYKNIEIIVIDDGSKDSTLKKIKQFEKKYPQKIISITRENKGIGYTRNEGIKYSTGDYIGFVDSDDYVDKEMYEKLLKHLTETDSDIVVCDYIEIINTSQTKVNFASFEPSSVKENPSLIRKINTGPVNKLYKKEIIENVLFPENIKYEDLPFVLLALTKAKKISKLNENLYYYYFNEKGETQSLNYQVFDIFKVLQITINEFPNNKKYKKELCELCIQRFYSYVVALFATNDRELILRFVDYGTEFLNSNFKGWQIVHLKNFENLKDIIVRLMQIIPSLHKIFIRKKIPKTKKKILFAHYSLCIGGVETALVNLINNMDFSKYDIILLLQHKEGEFLTKLDNRVEVKSFNIKKQGNMLYRKFINLINIIITILKHKNKYDFSASFGTGYKASSLAALYASKNNAAWMHTNISIFVNSIDQRTNKTTKEKVDKFLKNVKFLKFKKFIFVSQNAKETFINLYPNLNNKCFVCHNFIDYKKIIEKSKDPIDIKKNSNKINIVNIGRHTEFDKRISRIINAVNDLKDKYDIILYLIGDGADHKKYIEMVKELSLEKQVVFLGAQTNPYPYYLLGDVFVLSSAFEGFPTVYTEALTLNIPIVTTDVSDAQIFINKKYGLVSKNNEKDFSKTLDKFISSKFNIKEIFDPEKYNKKSLELIERLINNE